MSTCCPLVSIVTVTYNAENTLEETIKSILNQSYKNIEYIIIDGSSKDKTVDIIKKYEHNIHIWVSEPDNGIYDAMNKGATLANGEWVIFINAGDFLYNEFVIEEFARLLTFHQDYSILYGNILSKYKCGDYIVKPSRLENIIFHMPFCHQAAFVKRNLLVEYPFDINFRIIADHEWFLRMYKLNPLSFKYIPLDIAIFDAVMGCSSNNIELLDKELSLLLGNNRSTSLFRSKIKEIIPEFMMNIIHRFLYYINPRYKRVK